MTTSFGECLADDESCRLSEHYHTCYRRKYVHMVIINVITTVYRV